MRRIIGLLVLTLVSTAYIASAVYAGITAPKSQAADPFAGTSGQLVGASSISAAAAAPI